VLNNNGMVNGLGKIGWSPFAESMLASAQANTVTNILGRADSDKLW
jgi:hypothetical protein